MSYPSYTGQGGYPPGPPGQPGYPAAPPAGLPYAPQPYQQQPQPGYPAQPGGMPMPGPAPGPGYPLAQGSPYPTSGGGYPPASGSPYPHAGNADYPPQGGASPYPPAVNQSSYPPSQPATGGYPQPQQGGGGAYPPTAQQTAPYPSGECTSGAAVPAGGSSAPYPQPTQQPPARPAAQPTSQQMSRPTTQPTQTYKTTSVAPDQSLYYECAKKPGDHGLVKPLTSGFSPEKDATMLRNMLKSSFADESIIVNIFPYRTNAQRQKIRQFYKTMFGKDLLDDFRDKLTGDFESMAAALLMTPAECDAYQIHKAVEGLGTDEGALIEILGTRNNQQLNEMKRVYHEMYKISVEQDLKSDTGGNFKRLVVSLANAARQENQAVDHRKAEEDAKKLYSAGAGRLGTDESTFNSVFVSQSFDQLKAVFEAYQRSYKKDMEKVIKSEMSGDLASGMKCIVRYAINRHNYFAQVLLKSMKGLGTDEKTLIRVLVTRSEIDLSQIKTEFKSVAGKPLDHWIKKETSGALKDMILHLIRDK